MGENILDLKTIVDRPTIRITSKRHPKGKLYELLSVADFGPFEYAEILAKCAEADELRGRKQAGRRLTKAQTQRMEKAVNDIVSRLLPNIEPTVLAELTIAQKETIVMAWSARATDEAKDASGKA